MVGWIRFSVVIGFSLAVVGCATAQEPPPPPPPPPPPVVAPPPPPPPPPPVSEIRISSSSEVEDRIGGLLAQAEQKSQANDAAGAEALILSALTLARTELPLGSVSLPAALRAMGRHRIDQGRYEAALALLDEAVRAVGETPADPMLLADIYYDQARAFDGLGHHADTERAARASLEIRRSALGIVSMPVADATNMMALALAAQGRYGEADFAYRQVLATYEVIHGSRHPRVAMALSNLANSLRRTGRSAQAEPLYRRAVQIAEDSDDDVLLAQCLINYGWYLHLQGDGAKAEGVFRQALALAQQLVGDDHPFTGVARANLGYALSDQGRWTEAEGPFRDGLTVLEASMGSDSPDLLETLTGLAAVTDRLHGPADAEPLYRRARTIMVTRLSPAHADALEASELLAGFLIRHDRSAEALGEVRRSLGALIEEEGHGRDWRSRVRGARPLFGRRVEAAWLEAATLP